MRIKILVCTTIFALLTIVALCTNPTKQQYISWVKDELINTSNGQGVVGVLTSMIAPTILDGTTQTENYYLFSLYKTKIADNEMVTLGVFDKFIEIGKKENHQSSNLQ